MPMNNGELKITENINEGVYHLYAKGRIDSNTADLLLVKLEDALNNGHKTIILNMTQVDYLSSIGIRVILKTFKQANENGGSFNIDSPSEIVRNILNMVALKEILVTN
jgi:anti-anti-sigma factor